MKSRIAEKIEFPDYSANELMMIFSDIAKKKNMCLTEAAKLKLQQIFNATTINTNQKFGNARYVRNVFDKSYRMHATNCCNIENTEENQVVLNTLTVEEIIAVPT